MDELSDLIFFSHAAWDDLDAERAPLAEAARGRRVFFVEEPIYEVGPAFLATRLTPEGVMIVRAGLPEGTRSTDVPDLVRDLLERLMDEEDIAYCTVRFDRSCPPWFTSEFGPAIDEVANLDGYAAIA